MMFSLILTFTTLIPSTLAIPQAIPPAAYRYVYPPFTHPSAASPDVSVLPSAQVSVLPLPSSSPSAALPSNNPNPIAPTLQIHCTPWTNWTGGYKEKDCYKALDIFYEHDVIRYMRNLYEFVNKGERPVGREAPVWVPRAVVVKSCTIAIAMMGDMKGLPLPGEPEDAEYVRTDTGSYWDVYSMARRILGGCLSTLEEAGWGTVGEDQSIGVFVWGSNTAMHKANFGKVETSGIVLINAPANATATTKP